MRFRGYGSITDSWDATLGYLETLVPEWLVPSVVRIDVADGEAGLSQFVAIADTLSPDAKVMLSARAQAALLTIMRDESESLDRLFAASAGVPGLPGEILREVILARQVDLANRVETIQIAQRYALSRGVPEAKDDSAESARASWMWVLGIALVAAIVVTGWVCVTGVKSSTETQAKENVAGDLITAGRYAEAVELLRGSIPEATGKFPWGLALGLGVSLLGVGALFAWSQGFFSQSGRQAATT